ncbi:MAG: glycosyltransferase family 4 protein [Actinomycetota bacterium]
MSGRIFQVVPVLEPGDALGTHARSMAAGLGPRHGGFVVERADPSLAHLATRWDAAAVEPEDVLVYHVALSSHVGEWFRKVRARKVIDYHNITPSEYFRAYEPGLSAALASARRDLVELRGQVELAVAHSEFSRSELDEMGFAHTVTLPVLFDLPRPEAPANEELLEHLRGGTSDRADLLFVGRLAPNKHQEDLVKVFAFYRRLYHPSARLFLVGTSNSAAYERALRSFVERLGVEEVHLVGRVADEDLVAYYRAADVFVSMSEHEGFGVPWLEAMAFGLPVISVASAALPETVGAGGILVRRRDYEELAALVDLVMRDDGVRARLVEAGRARVEEVRSLDPEESYRGLLSELAGAEPVESAS